MLGFLDFVTLQGTRAMSSGNTGAPGAYVVGPPAKRPRTAVPTARSFSPPAAFRARPTAAATAGAAPRCPPGRSRAHLARLGAEALGRSGGPAVGKFY